MRSYFLSLLFTICLVASQVSAATNTSHSAVQYEKIATYTVDRLNQILTTEFGEFTSLKIEYPKAQCAVDLYKVTYYTQSQTLPDYWPVLGETDTMPLGPHIQTRSSILAS
jgi:hypothetical protein